VTLTEIPSADDASVSGKPAGSIIISRRLRWLVFIGTFGLLLFAGIATNALLQIRINSPLYKTISLSNNLIADYVPPSENLLEASLLCAKLVDAPNRESRELYETDLKAFQREYNSKYVDYMSRVPEGELKTMLGGEAHQTALEYFVLVDQLEALVNQNRVDEARTLLATTMNPLYDRHAAAVDRIVIRANVEARAAEAQAARSVDIYTFTVVAIGLLILFFEAVLSWFFAKGVSAQAMKLAKSEELLRASEGLYRSTFDQAAVGILHISFGGEILRSNARFAEMIDYPVEEIPGKTLHQLTPEEHLAKSDEALQQLVGGVSSRIGLEKPYLRKDGSLTWVKLSSSVQRDSSGQPIFIVTFVEDINERKAAETRLAAATAELQISESRYREIFDGALEGIYRTSPEGRALLANPALAKMLGYDSPEETLAKVTNSANSVWAIPDERARYLQLLEERGEIRGFECRYKRKDGTIIWISLNGKKVCGPAGKTLYYEGFIEDITERKLAEAKLRERDERLAEANAELQISESRYREIFDSALEGIFRSSPEGKSLLANPALARMLGYDSPEEMLHQVAAVSVWVDPNERAQCLRLLEEHGTILGYECRYKRKKGEAIWASLNCKRVIGPAGETLYYEGFIEDITERKLAEAKLRERDKRLAAATAELQKSESRYREIFDGALEGIYQISPEGRTLLANPAMAKILGYDSPEEAIATITNTVEYVWVDPDVRARHVRQLEERGESRGFECQFRRKDGTIIWVSLNGKKVCGPEGKTLYYEGFFEDITERKLAEVKLRERDERLAEAERLAYMGSSSWDLDSDTMTWSQGMYAITGREPGTPAPSFNEREELYTPESWARLKAAGERLLATGEPFDVEVQMRRADGALRWTRAHGVAIRNEAGRICRVAGTLRDITGQKRAEMKLRDSEEQFRSTFEQAAIGIVHVSFEGEILRCNRRFADIIGYSLEEVLGKNFLEFTPPEYMPRSSQLLSELGKTAAGAGGLEKPYLRKDGSLTWVNLTSSVQRDGKGKPLHLVTFVESIDARKAVEQNLAAKAEELRANEIRYRTVFQTTLDTIAITRLSDGTYLDVNQAFLDASGYTREEVIGHNWRELNVWVNPREREQLEEDLRRTGSCRDLESQFRKKNGEILWGLASASIVEIDGVPCLVAAARDITEAKDAVKMIRDLAYYDQLTHLPNRRSLLDHLHQPNSSPSRKRALLFVDLDNFKSINDALGHRTGDLLLQEAAIRLTESVRGDGTVACLGGNEFGVLLENLGEVAEDAAAQARIVADRIFAAGSVPYVLDGEECHCPPSIGITVFGSEPESEQEALQQGAIAMSLAKRAGRKKIRFFSPALQAAVNSRVSMENGLRRGLMADQFLLYFQPQVRENQLVGMEALVRWQHPKQGLLSPGAFIALAEETGTILALGDWVLEQSCMQLATWAQRRESADIPVAINISARQFHQPDFVERVLAVLDHTGANPRNLRLELTESCLADDLGDVIDKMVQLKSHGLRFSLDDFGTGYSSLAYLKRLPLDQLKIDRAFVQDILVDPASAAIAQAVIAMSRAMGFSVIAEGVETDEQRKALLDLGCDTFQGYLFGRPLPVEEFETRWVHLDKHVIAKNP
jgi:diguanylate cyclase (GGDEF)-like protein/PAS domain S-box-containing protein